MKLLKDSMLWVLSILIVILMALGVYAIWITLIVGALSVLIFIGLKVAFAKNKLNE
jgi:hypothetical protein